MGLDIVVETPVENLNCSFRAGSYSGFHAWRCCLADMLVRVAKIGDVDDPPFAELLGHSDCDGELSRDECKELLKDFEEFGGMAAVFVPREKGKDLEEGEVEWWRTQYRRWWTGVFVVAEFGGRMIFC